MGDAVWVGEEGRELMVFDRPGTIIPNDRIAAPVQVGGTPQAAGSAAAGATTRGGGRDRAPATLLWRDERDRADQIEQTNRRVDDLERQLRRMGK